MITHWTEYDRRFLQRVHIAPDKDERDGSVFKGMASVFVIYGAFIAVTFGVRWLIMEAFK